jgi:ABC-2 type transport system permease protein
VFGMVISTVMTVLTTVFLGAQIVDLLGFTAALLLTVVAHSALGALVAVSVKEVFEAQTLSNYFRFPMIFLCGVFIPLQRMPLVFQYLARLLPLTYSVDAFRAVMGGAGPGLILDLAVLALYCFALVAGSVVLLKRSL